MTLTISQAAALVGKSERQIRYLIKRGRLPARKVAGVWAIRQTDLQPSDGRREAQQRRDELLRDAADRALAPKEAKRRYSLRDMRAVRLALAAQRCAITLLGESHVVTVLLGAGLDLLAKGCHRYGRAEKGEAYRGARDAFSVCAGQLLRLEDAAAPTQAAEGSASMASTPIGALLDTIEQELLAAVGGLVRRTERRGR